MPKNLTHAEANEFLCRCNEAHIGFYDGIMPNVIPVKYLFEKGTFFVFADAGRAFSRLKKNVGVCISVNGYTDQEGKANVTAWGIYMGTTVPPARKGILPKSDSSEIGKIASGKKETRMAHYIRVTHITGWKEETPGTDVRNIHTNLPEQVN